MNRVLSGCREDPYNDGPRPSTDSGPSCPFCNKFVFIGDLWTGMFVKPKVGPGMNRYAHVQCGRTGKE
jgi:hypothetical protein